MAQISGNELLRYLSAHARKAGDEEHYPRREQRTRLETLPVEVQCEIFAFCDIEGAVALSQASGKFRLIFVRYFSSIVNEIIERDFTPVESIRNIISYQTIGEEMSGAFVTNSAHHDECLDCSPVIPESSAMRLSHCQMMNVEVCRTISGWEAAFPSLRFARHHAGRRSLLPHEAERVRSAICSWSVHC
jgi:hypothetical protein